MRGEPPRSFDVVQLNAQTDAGWAVVEVPSGAIAKDMHQRLLMRLAHADAIRIAKAMNEALERAKRPE